MIGDHYWATCIVVDCGQDRRGRWSWTARTDFYDDGFGRGFDPDTDDEGLSTVGTLHTRYLIPDGPDHQALPAVIDTVKADAERLRIVWKDPAIYLAGDGENHPVPPVWRELVAEQADRLGWDTYSHDRALGGGKDDPTATTLGEVP